MSSILPWLAGGLAAAGTAYLAGGVAPPKRLPTPSGPARRPPPADGPRRGVGAALVRPSPQGGRPRRDGDAAGGPDAGQDLPPERRRIRPWHAAAAGVVLGAIAPFLAPAPLLTLVITGRLADRRGQRRREGAVIHELPDLVDLLRLTTLAGLPVSAALRAIHDRPGGVVGAAVAHATWLLDRGATTVQALTAVGESCGPPGRSLVDALVDHDRYGTPLGPSLDRVAIEYRLRRRRRAEEAARRLPVSLLFPLVFATLPAFVLLTIVPLLAGSFQMLRV
jgi:tight adherence protein C